MGVISLPLILMPLAVDQDFRADVARHDWSDRAFRAMAIGFTYWIIIGAGFLGAALFIRRANIWGLLALTVANAAILTLIWRDAYGKDMVLIPPLCLSLMALLFEDCQILLRARRNPT
jgi:hypothetical protein